MQTDESLPSIQLLVDWEALPVNLRQLHSEQVSKLVKINGIVVSASSIKAKVIMQYSLNLLLQATRLTLQCRGCRQFLPNIRVKPGFEGYMLPRKCSTSQTGSVGVACPVDPYFIVPDKCKCVDYQVLKLQESPDSVPHGEMPRHMQLYCDR